jgi:hypothetical protein
VGAFALLVVLVALAVAAWWRRRRREDRQRDLMELCWRAGLRFAPVDPFPDTTWLAHPLFAHPRLGAENVVWDGHDGVRAFDLWYEQTSDDGSHPVRRWATCAAGRVPIGGGRLRVVPRTFEDAPRFGEEIRLELDAFDRRFRVECDDRRFAFALLDQRMMEAVLGLPDDVVLDLDEGTLVLWAPLLPPERVLLLFEAARAVERHVPRVVSELYPPRPDRGPHEGRWLQGRWTPEPTQGPAGTAAAPDASRTGKLSPSNGVEHAGKRNGRSVG